MTLVVKDIVLHQSRPCGCGYIEGLHVVVCPYHQRNEPLPAPEFTECAPGNHVMETIDGHKHCVRCGAFRLEEF